MIFTETLADDVDSGEEEGDGEADGEDDASDEAEGDGEGELFGLPKRPLNSNLNRPWPVPITLILVAIFLSPSILPSTLATWPALSRPFCLNLET